MLRLYCSSTTGLTYAGLILGLVACKGPEKRPQSDKALAPSLPRCTRKLRPGSAR